VLDAQYFGVAQRRRRVFVVGYLGDWRPAAEVLFEPESLRRDTAPSREAGQEVAGTFTARARSGGWSHDPNLAAAGYMQPVVPPVAGSLDTECGGGKLTHQSVANGHLIGTLTARMVNALGARDVEEGAIMPVSYALQGAGHTSQNSQGSGWNEEVSFTLNRLDVHGVAQPISFGAQMSVPQVDFDLNQTLQAKNPMAVAQPMAFDGYNQTLSATSQTIRSDKTDGDHVGMVMQHMAVRRLTPVECERLQGFPDGYTNIPWRKQPESPDGSRYKALGNSMAVPVMGWIGKRIQMRAGA